MSREKYVPASTPKRNPGRPRKVWTEEPAKDGKRNFAPVEPQTKTGIADYIPDETEQTCVYRSTQNIVHSPIAPQPTHKDRVRTASLRVDKINDRLKFIEMSLDAVESSLDRVVANLG